MNLGRKAREPAWAETGEVLLEARNLSFAIAGRPIVRNIDAVVRAGEVVALVGPNGAGKTTLFGLLAGDVEPTSGEVFLYGQPNQQWSRREMAMRRSVLPQHAAVSFPYLVEQIVWMGRAPWFGSSRMDDDEQFVEEAMAVTETRYFAYRQFQTLSGGERARVNLARTLAQSAQVLLLDEPTAALDLKHQEMVLRLLRARAAEGAACLVVLHDLGLAAAYGDRVIVLNNGRVEADGLPAEVMTEELLSRVYDQPIEVLPHPRSGLPWIVPVRQ